MSKTEFVMPSNQADIKDIQNAIKEASNSMFRIASEKDLIKDIAAAQKDKHSLAPGDFNKMVRVYHKAEYQKRVEQNESFNEMYEGIMGGIDPDLSV